MTCRNQTVAVSCSGSGWASCLAEVTSSCPHQGGAGRGESGDLGVCGWSLHLQHAHGKGSVSPDVGRDKPGPRHSEFFMIFGNWWLKWAHLKFSEPADPCLQQQHVPDTRLSYRAQGAWHPEAEALGFLLFPFCTAQGVPRLT